MNVRFFGGSKEEYLSIPKHNPLGLYFCADSRELFLGDKLLSDGIRVINTKCELPEFILAADGIIYYIVENRTGYVLSSDRTEWLPIFSAPATDMGSVQESDADTTAVSVAALRELERAVYEKIASVENVSGVKTISFAGIELTKVDRVFSIDRETALKALGISFTESSEEPGITELATKEYVDKQIDTIPGTDLTGYATEEFVNKKIAEAELKDKEADLEAYYTKSEVDARIPDVSEFIKEIPAEYITESELEAKGYLTEHQDLSEYAKLTDLPEDKIFVVDFATPNFTAALEAYNAGKLLLLTNAAPDPNSYAVMNYVRDDMITFTKFLMSRSSAYGVFNTYYLHNDNTWELAKEVKLNKVEANVSDEPMAELSTVRIGKEVYSIPSTKGLASTEYVDTKLAEVKVPTKVSELDNDAGYLVEQDLDEYAKKEDLFSGSYNDLTDKPEIPSIEGLATEEFVNTAIGNIELPEAELYKVDFNAPNYAEAVEAYNSGKVLVLVNAAPDVNSYALMNYVSDNYITFTKFLTSRSEAYGYFNTYYLSPANTWELSKEVRLNKVEANAEGEINGDLTNIRIGKEIYRIPTGNSDSYTKEEVDALIPEIPENVSAFANDAGYLTGTDLSDYSTKAEMSSAITNAIANKADKIPFAVDKFVNNPIGGFTLGDNLNGLPLIEILAKLLELSDVKPGTDEPENPSGIVETIIANQTPMYAVTDTGAVEPITWSDVLNYTEETAVAKPEVSGFYQITKDDGTVEHGYQQVSAVYADMPYIIALPKALDFATNVTVQSWNDLESKWIVDDTTKNAMSSDAALFESFGMGALSDVCPGVDTTEYTIWFLDVASTGIIYRFIINE